MIIWAWKWLAEMEIVKTLSRRTTTVVSVGVFGLIFFQYRTIFSQESSSSLLLALAAMKVMDYENRRDHLMLVLLGFLLLTLKPLYGLDLYWLPIQLVCMISLWWALSQDPRKIPRPMIGWIYLSALPIALLLFLIFPRIVLPWAFSHAKGRGAQMGFSNDLNPGQVAELAASSDLVFRVRFLSALPIDARDMYWRGARLNVSNGLSWKENSQGPKEALPNGQSSENDIIYELIQEPGSGNAIFTLEPTYNLVGKDAAVFQPMPNLWRGSNPQTKSQRYVGRARAIPNDLQVPSDTDLQIPPLPPRTAQWVRETKAAFPDIQGRRVALHDLFAKNDFVYTLTPGNYNRKALDEFLFVRRRGFCEHFAGSFATLARALGIPARVISGYQGADFNPLGNFWRVTQKQAHAWAEVWNGHEWERQDPTGWVPHSEYSRNHQKSFFEWIESASDLYETLNYRWTTFLIDFDQKAQMIALKEWLPPIFLGCLFLFVGFFLFRLVWGWFFTPGDKSQSIRQQQLVLLVQQIKEAEEEYQNQDLSHLPPLSILSAAQSHLFGSRDFYQRVIRLYDRAVYQTNIEDAELKAELKELQRKWVEIQVLQK
jgi:transglutaminase-like putative cysteine protease